MKHTVFFLLGTSAALAFAACASNDAQIGGGGGSGGKSGDGGGAATMGNGAAGGGEGAGGPGPGGGGLGGDGTSGDGGSGGAGGTGVGGAGAGGNPTGSGGHGGANAGGNGSGGDGTGGAGGGCTEKGRVVINELLSDPPSADGNKEWIEFYNPTCASVILTGFQIEAGTSTYGLRFTFPAASIAPLGYIVVGGTGVAFADYKSATSLNFGNGANTDAVRLLTPSGKVVDTLLYSSPNSDGWADDAGNEATSLAPNPTSSQSLARKPNGVDTNKCGDDFVATHKLTPGAENEY